MKQKSIKMHDIDVVPGSSNIFLGGEKSTSDDKYISIYLIPPYVPSSNSLMRNGKIDRNLMALCGSSRATELRLAVSEHLSQMQAFNYHFCFLPRFWLLSLFSLPGNPLNAQMHGTNLQLADNSIY